MRTICVSSSDSGGRDGVEDPVFETRSVRTVYSYDPKGYDNGVVDEYLVHHSDSDVTVSSRRVLLSVQCLQGVETESPE